MTQPSIILDEMIKNGYGEKIITALAHYFKIPVEAITVSNDHTSRDDTLIILRNVDPGHPKIKLRLTEMGRHHGTQIDVENIGPSSTIQLRIPDNTLYQLTEAQLAKLAGQ